MKKRTGYGMIFVPILCLLIVLLGCIFFARDEMEDYVLTADAISEVMDISQPLELSTPTPLVETLILNAPSPSEFAESPPPHRGVGLSVYR